MILLDKITDDKPHKCFKKTTTVAKGESLATYGRETLALDLIDLLYLFRYNHRKILIL